MTDENTEQKVDAKVQAELILKQITKSAMRVDDILNLFQSELNKAAEENTALKAKIAELEGPKEEN